MFIVYRILYTGDFRFEVSEISVNPLPLLRSLHDPNGDPLVIGELNELGWFGIDPWSDKVVDTYLTYIHV